MQVEYLSVYTIGARPVATKRITDASGESIDTPIAFEFASEISQFTEEDVYEHLNNLVLYIRDTSQNLTPVGLDSPVPEDGWHLDGGWGEIEWANNEAFKWWNYIYYKDDEDISVTLPVVEDGT